MKPAVSTMQRSTKIYRIDTKITNQKQNKIKFNTNKTLKRQIQNNTTKINKGLRQIWENIKGYYKQKFRKDKKQILYFFAIERVICII